MESGVSSWINSYLRDSTFILPLGALQSFQVVAGTIIVHQLPAAFCDAILLTRKCMHDYRFFF